jgi:hypothetical protein
MSTNRAAGVNIFFSFHMKGAPQSAGLLMVVA